MIRYSIFIITVLATAATALASVKPLTDFAIDPTAVTVIYKNLHVAPAHKIVLEKCALEDCSDTQS
jgi:hypothetical protein